MLALAAFDYCLHDSGEYAVDYRRIACRELLTDGRDRLSMIRTVKIWPILESLLVLQLLEQVYHELVAIVLHDWIEAATEQILQRGLDDPLLRTRRLTIDQRV